MVHLAQVGAVVPQLLELLLQAVQVVHRVPDVPQHRLARAAHLGHFRLQLVHLPDLLHHLALLLLPLVLDLLPLLGLSLPLQVLLLFLLHLHDFVVHLYQQMRNLGVDFVHQI